jgi:hypothetical protein
MGNSRFKKEEAIKFNNLRVQKIENKRKLLIEEEAYRMERKLFPNSIYAEIERRDRKKAAYYYAAYLGIAHSNNQY